MFATTITATENDRGSRTHPAAPGEVTSPGDTVV
jgi:hypothetical protein